MTLPKFAFITQDLDPIKSLETYNNYWDLNPKRIDDQYQLVFLFLDSEENFKKAFQAHNDLNGFLDKIIGIYPVERNMLNWLQSYPIVQSCLDLNQLKRLLDSQHDSPIHDGLFLKVKNRFEKIKFNQIRWIMAKDVYCIIRTLDARYLVSHSLKELEEKLISYANFKRIHRSYIVNIDCIEAIQEGELIIDSEPIPIGPSYKEDLFTRLLFM